MALLPPLPDPVPVSPPEPEPVPVTSVPPAPGVAVSSVGELELLEQLLIPVKSPQDRRMKMMLRLMISA
jgi:hypothetical protein